MKGIIQKVTLKNLETKEGKKFQQLEFRVIVEGYKRPLRATMSIDYAKKYFKFCGLESSGQLHGMSCHCTVGEESFISSDGEPIVFEKIRYLNLLDGEGNPITLPKDKQKEEIEF